MQRLMRKICILSVLLIAALGVSAQNVDFQANAPSVVATNEVFRIEFSLNAKPEKFTEPKITGVDVLAGPTTSQGQSISIINGNMTQTINFTYTYVLQSLTPGRIVIPPASVVVDGKTYTTKELPIEVVGEDDAGRSAANKKSGSGKPQSNKDVGGKIGPEDLFVRASVNKSTVYKGQPVKVTFKLYMRGVPTAVESVKYPAFNGFWSQEVANVNRNTHRETLNSKVYDAVVINEYLLYPQQSGVLHIEQFDLDVVAQIVVQQRRQSLIDDFFGGGATVKDVRKKLSTAPVKITVKDLPAGAPDSFSGAVGRFKMTSDVSASSISVNSATTYTIKISGAGNLPLIQSPKLTLPSSFEQYNIKTTESLNNNGAGINGYRQFEYPFIARAEGDYVIPSIPFTYFDPEQIKYITLTTAEVDLNVLPDSSGRGVSSGGGMVSGLTKEDIKILGQDIRFIKIGRSGLVQSNYILIGSRAYFLILLLIVIIFVITMKYLDKMIKEMSNSVLVRGRRANKVALQRLRAAETFMKDDNQRRFYEEMLRAFWGYMSDKLNIPMSNLTKDNVRDELLKRGLAPEYSEQFIKIVSECEYAQYSPAVSRQMKEVYNEGVALISQYESMVK